MLSIIKSRWRAVLQSDIVLFDHTASACVAAAELCHDRRPFSTTRHITILRLLLLRPHTCIDVTRCSQSACKEEEGSLARGCWGGGSPFAAAILIHIRSLRTRAAVLSHSSAAHSMEILMHTIDAAVTHGYAAATTPLAATAASVSPLLNVSTHTHTTGCASVYMECTSLAVP